MAIKSKLKTNVLILAIVVLIAVMMLFCLKNTINQAKTIEAIREYTEQTQELTNRLINIIDYVK